MDKQYPLETPLTWHPVYDGETPCSYIDEQVAAVLVSFRNEARRRKPRPDEHRSTGIKAGGSADQEACARIKRQAVIEPVAVFGVELHCGS